VGAYSASPDLLAGFNRAYLLRGGRGGEWKGRGDGKGREGKEGRGKGEGLCSSKNSLKYALALCASLNRRQV